MDECLTRGTARPDDCEELVIAGLTGPDAWRDSDTAEEGPALAGFLGGGGADGTAAVRQRSGPQAAGLPAPQGVWSDLGTGQLLLVTLLPPLAVLALGYLALGRRYA